jgi:hypothetical protein
MDLSTPVEARLAPRLPRYSMLGRFLRLLMNRSGVPRRFLGLGMGACLVRLSGLSYVRLTRFGRMRMMRGHRLVSFSVESEQNQRGTGDCSSNQDGSLLQKSSAGEDGLFSASLRSLC